MSINTTQYQYQSIPIKINQYQSMSINTNRRPTVLSIKSVERPGASNKNGHGKVVSAGAAHVRWQGGARKVEQGTERPSDGSATVAANVGAGQSRQQPLRGGGRGGGGGRRERRERRGGGRSSVEHFHGGRFVGGVVVARPWWWWCVWWAWVGRVGGPEWDFATDDATVEHVEHVERGAHGGEWGGVGGVGEEWGGFDQQQPVVSGEGDLVVIGTCCFKGLLF